MQVIPTAELVGAAEEAVARWEPLAGHPNLVGLREAFASDEWDSSPSLFFVHDYHPGVCGACAEGGLLAAGCRRHVRAWLGASAEK